MSRSKWKGPYVQTDLLKQISKVKNCKKTNFKIFCRNSTIIPQFIGLHFNIHTGKLFVKIEVSEIMVGHKFGEFCPTRKKFSYKKKKN